jgi:hypothetical protein
MACRGSFSFALAASLLAARPLGGFFAAGAFPPAGGLFGTEFYFRDLSSGDGVVSQALWNLKNFGFLLLVGTAGLFRATRDRVFWLILAALPIVIVNSLRYRYSWDIVQFATVGSIALGVGAGIFLSEFLRWANTRLRQIIWGLLVNVLLGQGVIYPFIFLLSYDPGRRAPFFSADDTTLFFEGISR